MKTPFVLLKFFAKALGNAMGAGVAGDLAIEVLPAVANDVWDWWYKEQSADERIIEIEILAEAKPEVVRATVADIVKENVRDKSKRREIEALLNEIPAAVRAEKRETSGKLKAPRNARELLDFLPGRQIDIIDAILGAYPFEGDWLSARDQVEILEEAFNAKLPNGKMAFPAMANWDHKDRTNRMRKHAVRKLAEKSPRKANFKLAQGVTPAMLGVSQAVVDALAKHKVIAHYDIHATAK